jgi:membrane-associated protease RseP (regulator of RpoE activity)
MSIYEGLLIFFTILIIYFGIVILLKKIGFLEKHNISLYGPALLLRTKKGIKFLKKISNKNRFWKSFGNTGIIVCFIVMIIMIVIFIWQAWMLVDLNLTPQQKEILPGPEMILFLPGINPILPLDYIVYMLIAIVVAVVFHEFSHGILALAHNVKVKSLGILYFIIPIGAFTEPDEEELKKTNYSNRMRVYAAGPLSNLIVAFVALILFSFVFMAAVSPADGVSILYVIDDSPADEAGLSAGVVIYSVNDTVIKNRIEFNNVINQTSPNQEINISYYRQGELLKTNATLASYYNYTKNESYINMSFLGVGFNPYSSYISALKNPFTSKIENGFLFLYSIPVIGYFSGYNPIVSPFIDSYIISEPLNIIPPAVFWGIVNTFYWIFWINLAVALFNALPIGPLDGGFIFNDALGLLVKKLKNDMVIEKREKLVKRISLIISLIILSLVLFPVIFKYI